MYKAEHFGKLCEHKWAIEFMLPLPIPTPPHFYVAPDNRTYGVVNPFSNFAVNVVSADGLAPLTSSDSVVTKFRIFTYGDQQSKS